MKRKFFQFITPRMAMGVIGMTAYYVTLFGAAIYVESKRTDKDEFSMGEVIICPYSCTQAPT